MRIAGIALATLLLLAGCSGGCPPTWTTVESVGAIAAPFRETGDLLAERLAGEGFTIDRTPWTGGRDMVLAHRGNLTVRAWPDGHFASRTNITFVAGNVTELTYTIAVGTIRAQWGFENETLRSRAWAQPLVDSLHARLVEGTQWPSTPPSPTLAHGYVC